MQRYLLAVYDIMLKFCTLRTITKLHYNCRTFNLFDIIKTLLNCFACE